MVLLHITLEYGQDKSNEAL